MMDKKYSNKLTIILYSHYHFMKLCGLTWEIYLTDARQNKKSLNRSPYKLINFINIEGLLIKSNYPEIQENKFFVALASSI